MTTKTSSEILLEAANLLEEEQEATWGKGKYFQLPSDNADKPCIMCAHGAIAYCGDNKVKKNIMNKNLATAPPTAAAVAVTAINCVEYYTNLAAKENLSLEQYLLKYHGETGLAHYKAVKAGLTFNFNDNVAKSKQDVINKLREAAVL